MRLCALGGCPARDRPGTGEGGLDHGGEPADQVKAQASIAAGSVEASNGGATTAGGQVHSVGVL